MLFGVAGTASYAAAAASIEAVRVWRAPDHTRVVLDLSAPAKHRFFTLADPQRIVIDLEQARSATQLNSIDLQGTPLARIRGAERSGGAYRLVLDADSELRPEIFALQANAQYGYRLVIDLYDPNAEPVKLATSSREHGKRDLVIAIDAGHGGEDPGATGPRRVREKNVVMQIARKMQRLLNAQPGYKAVLVRDGDYYVGLRKRRDLARRSQADLFLSIHADAFKDKKVSGASVYTLSQRGASSASARFLADSENKADRIGGVDLSNKDDMLASVLLDLSMTATLDASARVAKNILSQLGDVSKLHKRGVEHAGFAVLKSPDIPSVLIETGFISNPSEERRLSSAKHQQQVATAVVAGIQRYFAAHASEGTLVYWQKNNPKLASNAAASPASATRYKVRAGDTLSELAQRNKISVAALRSYNGFGNDKIRVGQVILIPPAR
ncbi:MAG: N-acetylmuramoyl-L-alanine amidase [Gammaproteobacteria bacterium]|nr:N-acetylmuramoyl-L-alanine amidase [Gammaproteobacteria bacterium]